MLEVYGITGCDKVKDSLDWLKANGLAFRFHDLRKESVSSEKLEDWMMKTKGNVLNKRSTTWRGLSSDVQQKLSEINESIRIMQEQPTIIKRPVIEYGNDVLAGFDVDLYQKKLK